MSVQTVRLSVYCPNSIPGHHVPHLAAEANRLAADQEFQVELLDSSGGPDNIKQVAAEDSDF